MLATFTGAGGSAFVVPSPSWPFWFQPQQVTEPSDPTAHVCLPPAEMELAELTPEMTSGVDDGEGDSAKSCPKALSPQQPTVPSCMTAHVWVRPDATARVPFGSESDCGVVGERPA
jgi:hypothetical protein